MIDRADPTLLTVAIKKNQEYVQLTLHFKDAIECLSAKRSVEYYRKQSKERSVAKVQQLLNSLLNCEFQ